MASKNKKESKKTIKKTAAKKPAAKKVVKKTAAKKPAAKKVVKKTAAKKPAAEKVVKKVVSKSDTATDKKEKPKRKSTKVDKKIQKIGSDANRSLSKYLQEISKYEPLHPEREVELAIRVKQGDRRALKELTEAIQFIENKRNVNVYLMPKDHEKEYEKLQIHL